MGRKEGDRRPNRSQRPIKGFRPGKEPGHLKKQRAMARLGSDASWVQKQTVEAVLLVLAYRLWKQGSGLVEMAESL